MNSTRENLERIVSQKPGISFTQLKEETELANGVLQYHIRKSKNIEKEKGSLVPKEYCGECKLKDFCNQKCILKELRKDLTSEILNLLSREYKQAEIAEELDLDRSTVNYHIKKLEKMNVLRDGEIVIDLESLDV